MLLTLGKKNAPEINFESLEDIIMAGSKDISRVQSLSAPPENQLPDPAGHLLNSENASLTKGHAKSSRDTPPLVSIGPVGDGNAPTPNRAAVKARSVGLDVMRFIAVTLVLYTHANIFDATRKFFNAKIGLGWDQLYRMREGSWVGVDIFFVLSGFLISGLLFQELAKTGTVSPGRFLVRRGFKIYPPFWVMILATVIGIWWQGQSISVKTLLTELCFVQNYVVGPPPSYVSTFWGSTWSLAVEEHFYLLLAGLFFILKQRTGPIRSINIDFLPKLFLGVALGCLAARVVTWSVLMNMPRTMIWFMRATHVRMDTLFFGVLLSYYWHTRWDEAFKATLLNQRRLLAGISVVLLFSAIYVHEEWFPIFGFILTYLGAGCLLISLLSLDRSPCHPLIRLIAWLGKHSYSVYLWHLLAGSWLLSHITFHFSIRNIWGGATNLLIYFILCWTVGIAMSLLVEVPMLRLRDRFFPWLRNSKTRPAGTKCSRVWHPR
jgi:peptidoglycan/LPS O-acetylase OafA/YrhL